MATIRVVITTTARTRITMAMVFQCSASEDAGGLQVTGRVAEVGVVDSVTGPN